MDQRAEDIERLHKQAVPVAPPIAVALCVGSNGETAAGHHPFVVIEQAAGEKFRWKEGPLAEYDNLAEALEFPGAQPYPTSTLCTPCEKLSKSRR